MTSTCAMLSPSCSTQPPPRCMKRTESGEWVTMMSALFSYRVGRGIRETAGLLGFATPSDFVRASLCLGSG